MFDAPKPKLTLLASPPMFFNVSKRNLSDNAEQNQLENLLGLRSDSSDVNHGCNQERNYILHPVSPLSRVTCLYRDFTLTEESEASDAVSAPSRIDITPALNQRMQATRRFSLFGLVFLEMGIVPAVFLACLRFNLEFPIASHPLLVVAIVLLLTGLQLFCFGLLAGVLLRMYYDISQDLSNPSENPLTPEKVD